MSPNEKLAIAAHLHVLMRRKTGRVTDTEWMASDPAYAAEIVRLAHQKAAEGGHDDLGLLADRLEAAMALADPPAQRPLVSRWSEAVAAHTAFAPGARAAPLDAGGRSSFGHSPAGAEPNSAPPPAPRYVRGLR